MSSLFFDKLLSKIGKIDETRLRTHLVALRSEWKKQETILQSIQEGVVVLTQNFHLNDANLAAERLLGFSLEKMRGEEITKYFPDIDLHTLANSQNFTRELEITYPEHRILSIYAINLPVQEPASPPLILIIIHDITHEREQEANALEGGRNDAIAHLAAGVAHEIGNPLNALNLNLQLLGREIRTIDDQEMRTSLDELVSTARSEITRLDSIIREFLGAIRPSKPDLRPDHPLRVIGETLNVLREQIESRNIRITIKAPQTTHEVMLDPDKIKQVFFNLIKNSMEALSDNGQIEILIKEDDNYQHIDVIDNGEGIEDLTHIFEAYHTTKPHGTGLGLMIVRRIIRDHSGTIEISSKKGEGTRVRISLPLATRRIRKLKN